VGRYAAQHPVLEQLNQKLEARSDTLRRRVAVYVEKRIQRAYPEAARRQPTAVQKGKADFLSAADLLWLFVIGAFLGRHGGDRVLPPDRRGVDEPFQSGVGAFQRGVGAGAGRDYRAAAAESG